jgi:peptide/nickel transport system permease protein
MLLRYLIKRILIAIPILLVISFCVFMIIQLPPGSYLDAKMQQMKQQGQVDMTEINQLRQRYHMDRNPLIQYRYWIVAFVQGDWGQSFEYGVEVWEILKDELPATMAISLFTILFEWSIALPFGILAAVKRNTLWDYCLTFIGLVAMATPSFVIALVFMVVMQSWWPNFDPTGLFSSQYSGKDWDWPKFADMLKHVWVPIFLLGVAGTAGMIRILRANVIDELRKQYVLAARARGLHPALVVLRYPVRVAINPLISSVAGILPALISGSVIVAQVLNLPILGPKLLTALFSKDTYLASSIVFFQCILSIVGIMISDMLLALVDPRIKFGSR